MNKIKFEHVKGEDNKIADLLSRILIKEGKPLYDTEFINELRNEFNNEDNFDYEEENIIDWDQLYKENSDNEYE